MTDNKDFDVIIVGGSYAGLSAAMALGRSLRKVLIVDSGLPCNRPTPHSHNFITQDGETPRAIAEKAKTQVLQYPAVSFLHGVAVGGRKAGNGFILTLQSGEEFNTRKLLFATGLKDIMPDIPGFSACWGITLIHCPYCHGYEFRSRKTGIMANGEKAVHLAALVKNLTEDITILTGGRADFNAGQMARLSRHNIAVVEAPISAVDHDHGQIRSLIFSDGSRLAFDAVYAAVPFTQHSDIPASLGCELTEQGYIKVDQMQKTTLEGVFACGDNTGMMRSVANAVYGGNIAGAAINKALVDEWF